MRKNKVKLGLSLLTVLVTPVMVNTVVSHDVNAEYRESIFYNNNKPANWWYNDGTDWYFFQNGKKFTGYGKDNSGVHYFVNGKYAEEKKAPTRGYVNGVYYVDGKVANWWYDDGTDWYFFQNGKKFTGYGKDNSGVHYFVNGKYAEEKKAPTRGYVNGVYYVDGKVANWWYDDGTDWYFFQNGKKLTGYGKDNSGVHYFVNGKYVEEKKAPTRGYVNGIYYVDGKVANWWYDDGIGWYFFQNGKKFTGYGKDNAGTHYFVNGKYAIAKEDNKNTKRVNVRTETIKFKTVTRYNNQLAKGTRNVLTAGKNGSYKVVRDDIYEGNKLVKQGAEQNIDRIEAVNEVIEIGTKVKQTTKRVNVRTETIKFKTVTRYNNQLAKGTRNVLTAGKNGSYKVVRDDIYEGNKLVKQGTEQNIDRIEAVNEVVEIGTKVPQATTDTYFVLDTENNWFVTSEQTDALTKLFGTANGNVDVISVAEKLKNPENYKLFNKLNLRQYFNKVNNPASVQKMINDYAFKNQLEINKKFIDLANAERVKAGLVPAVSAFDNVFNNVQIDKFVQDMVNERTKEMADHGSLRYLGKKEGKHKRHDGRSWYTVYSEKGIDLTGSGDGNHRYNMAGENAGQGNWDDLDLITTPDVVIKEIFGGWMASPGHRALILNDVPHPIFAFSYRQGLKDYLGSKNKPTVAMLHVTSWFNPLDYPISKLEYEKWRLDPKNKDNIVASEEYYTFLKANTKNKVI